MAISFATDTVEGWDETTTAASTITLTTGTNYLQAANDAIIYGSGAVEIKHVPWHEQNKCRPRRFLEELREEIGEWHGNVLERAA